MSRIALGCCASFIVAACTSAGEDAFSGATTGSGANTTSSTAAGPGPGSGGGTPGSGGAGGVGPSTTASSSASSTASVGPGGSGGGGQGGFGGNPVDAIGCSDGTREGYVDIASQPNIAACSGGFEVPGVTTNASMSPACNRVSGNDSINDKGTGCSVEDLCSEGWHVCHGAVDVGQSSATGQCDVPVGVGQEFWLTRQVQDSGGQCAGPPWTNNLSGCGTLGTATDNTCAPLDRRMRYVECIPTAAWYCGNNDADTLLEAEIVVKIGPQEGGVLCCRN